MKRIYLVVALVLLFASTFSLRVRHQLHEQSDSGIANLDRTLDDTLDFNVDMITAQEEDHISANLLEEQEEEDL